MTDTPYFDDLPCGTSVRPPRPQPNGVPDQMLFREANEQIYLRHAPDEPDSVIDIVCECHRRTCSNVLRISLGRYDAIRQFPTWFVMTSGHSHPDDERIIEEHDEFVVVEKTGREPESRFASTPASASHDRPRQR
jgi:hypothetical protein